MSSLRAARWILLVVAGTTSVILVVTAWQNFSAVRNASADIHRGQATALLDSFFSYVRLSPGPPSQDVLDDWLVDRQDDGVRFIAQLGRHRLVSGTPSTDIPKVSPDGQFFRIVLTGDRVRVIARPAQRRRARRRFGTRPVVATIIEFEPLAWNALLSSARRGLWVGGLVAVSLLGAALLAFLWLRGRDTRDAIVAERERLAELGEMSAVLAHEIRNPLASLKGNAQLLEESAQDEKTTQKAARIVREAQRMQELTTDLLDFVRTGRIERSQCDPCMVLQDATEATGVPVSLDRSKAPRLWSLDKHRVQQLLNNLLRNAIEAAPNLEVEARVDVSNKSLRYVIRDRGKGLPPGEEQRIFQPFHTGKIQGTGLGLAVARRIARAHGGELGAYNHPQGGAVFTATIPGAEDS